jgi:hypothetical protein
MSRRGPKPNGRVAPHQERHGDHTSPLVSARELGEAFQPNRAQRRDYVRLNQTRQVRKHIVGFGRWRRHRDRTYETHAKATALGVEIPPRRERRPIMIRAYRQARNGRLGRS